MYSLVPCTSSSALERCSVSLGGRVWLFGLSFRILPSRPRPLLETLLDPNAI